MPKKQTPLNFQMLAIVLVLLAFGLVVLYSASTVESFNHFGTTTYYFIHQLLFGALGGLVAMYLLSRIDYHVWKKFVPHLIFVSLVLLALVKFPGIGMSSGGASRWIHLGPQSFQPSELAKLAIIFYIAAWIEKKKSKLPDFWFDLLPSLVITGLFALLILWQPDLGTMLVLVSMALMMLFVGGIDWKHFLSLLAGGAFMIWLFVKIEPYRARRITTFFDSSIDPKGISYQINQSLLAIGSGKLWGYGYGLSRQKHNYLPEPFGDSIFAVLAEELGYFRSVILLVLFLLFAWKGIEIAKAAPDIFGRMVAIGITCMVTIQALINIGAMVGVLPLTGIPLPFFSYGSSSLFMALAGIGILLNISRQTVRNV